MNINAIIAEYNPFHNGHKYLIKKAKNNGCTHNIAIMSSNFMQRGDISIISKEARAKMALSCGIDLVIEMPTICSLSNAQRFAKSAIYLAKSLGVVDSLCFGCECDELAKLKKAASIEEKLEFNSIIKNNLKSAKSFASIRQEAIRFIAGEDIAEIFSHPNNNLAIEYIKAAKILNFEPNIIPILRKGPEHNSLKTDLNFSSASFIRENIYKLENIQQFMPEKSFEILNEEINQKKAPNLILNLERAILLNLKFCNLKAFSNLPEISEGLEFRLYKEIQKADSLNDLFFKIKTKRYPLARIRRILLYAVLGITRDHHLLLPNFIKVLGFNKKGTEILKLAKQKSTLPILTKYSEFKNINSFKTNEFLKIENHAKNFYSLCMPKIKIEKNEPIIFL